MYKVSRNVRVKDFFLFSHKLVAAYLHKQASPLKVVTMEEEVQTSRRSITSDLEKERVLRVISESGVHRSRQ